MHRTDAAHLAKLGIITIHDLLHDMPYAVDSYGGPVAVSRARPGVLVTITGTVVQMSRREARYRTIKYAQGMLRDDEGGLLKLVFFRQPWIASSFPIGTRVAVAGQAKPTAAGPDLEMVNPMIEALGPDGIPKRLGGLVSRYHLTGGLSQRRLHELVDLILPMAGAVEDVLPDTVRVRHRLMPVAEALRAAHRPRNLEDHRAAMARMAFAELFILQAAFIQVRRQLDGERATPIPYRQEVIDAFKTGLGFELTRAQRRSLWEIFQDLDHSQPMNRLLNGDVGSGKTAVAAGAVAMAHAAGFQSVVMAPTEILARQHLGKFRQYLEVSFPDLRVELLVSGLPAAERRRVLTATASGHCALLVGTHALIEEAVEFPNLGLAVVDEQHRFGTRQRELLRAKGRGRPHFLAMTATPIPRSLALAMYGEMSLSQIDEMPPGRTPVRTRVLLPDHRDEAYALVRREVAAGHQAFVICALVEESEALDVRAATAEYERLRTDVFPDLRVSLVHGRMREKDAVMRAFGAGESDILVATSVVEVGVDVPNATVMMIEGAERFGLAQLHQFRGRVGRSDIDSHCLLLVEQTDRPMVLHRLNLMTTLHDGFRLAEEDLRLRGHGELMGERQHGLKDLAMRALAEPELLNEVRQEAELTLDQDPGLEGHPALRAAIERRMNVTSFS